MPIDVIRADITMLDVDAIVNAANERMLGGGGVDGAIHRAAGPQLRAACRQVPEVRPGIRCPTGDARLTPGFRLRARHVIHTVGPVWRGGAHGEPELLASCYRRSLELARANGLRSIAFPAISCGVYGYPIDDAAAIAVREARAFLDVHDVPVRVVLVAFDEHLYGVLTAKLAT
jgi:O-acetyl-ADP-ribose deacetylase (regulator of RNase III)